MSREGKEFELLIKRLEELHLSDAAIVKSPDYLIDKITGQKREVDISIRMNAGTSEILIIVECRDRNDVEDVTWIEQLVTKTKDVKADKIIAVSSTGFTGPAVKKAEHNGIEARTYTEVTLEYIKEWFQITHMECEYHTTKILHVIFTFAEGQPHATIPVVNSKDLVFKIINTGEMVSMQQIVDGQLPPNHIVWDKVQRDGTILTEVFKLNFVNENDRFGFPIDGVDYTIAQLLVKAELSIRAEKLPISKVEAYKGTEGSISEVVEFTGLEGPISTMQIIKDKTGGISLGFPKTEDDKTK